MTHDDTPHADPHDQRTRRIFGGLFVGMIVFGATGTVTSVWANPLFVRMTPLGAWELPATFFMGLFSAFIAGFWTPACRLRQAGGGGLASFLGVACPVCNKLLLLVFGAPALLAWFNPLRPYVTVAGLCAMGWAAWRTLRAFEAQPAKRSFDRRRLTGDIE